MRIGEIIRQYRTEHGLSLRAFASQSNISPSYVRKLEMDVENKSSITIPKISSIAKAMGLTPDELLAAMDDTTVDLRPEKNPLPANIIPVPEMKKVPMLGAVACGEPIYMDEVRGEYYPMDSSIHADFCLRAQGDSMTGARIYDGDIVFIQSSPVVENGQIAAVAIDDEATLKYFYQYGDTVVLRPANAKYEEMTYSREDLDHLRILGRAVAFQSAL
ncbi:LexA family protein [Faecalibaculum rodentium]|uniref:LexA family protein n=2 Tax=Faecalibaculum rodentium TaxID=1702221 RepID=UPI0025B79784|nr:S24 family peptidase [Faecalibaculum rodentium]